MDSATQLQRHHHRVFTLALIGRVVLAAQAHLHKTGALVQRPRTAIAGAHFQPERGIATGARPAGQLGQHGAAQALTLVGWADTRHLEQDGQSAMDEVSDGTVNGGLNPAM